MPRPTAKRFADLRGGLNKTLEPHDLTSVDGPTMTPDALNVLGQDGGVYSRSGFRNYIDLGSDYDGHEIVWIDDTDVDPIDPGVQPPIVVRPPTLPPIIIPPVDVPPPISIPPPVIPPGGGGGGEGGGGGGGDDDDGGNPPPPPCSGQIITPYGCGETVNTTTPTLTWAAPTNAVAYYVVSIYTGDVCGGTLVHTSDPIAADETSYQVPGGLLSSGNTYSWLVYGPQVNGCLALSSCCSFDVDTGPPPVEYEIFYAYADAPGLTSWADARTACDAAAVASGGGNARMETWSGGNKTICQRGGRSVDCTGLVSLSLNYSIDQRGGPVSYKIRMGSASPTTGADMANWTDVGDLDFPTSVTTTGSVNLTSLLPLTGDKYFAIVEDTNPPGMIDYSRITVTGFTTS